MANNLVQRIISYVALFTMAALFLLPFAWMLSTSLKHEQQIFAPIDKGFTLLPTTNRTDAEGRTLVRVDGQTGTLIGETDNGQSRIMFGSEERTLWPDEYDIETQIGIHWQNYVRAFQLIDFPTNLRNTLFICYTVVLATMLSCSLVAYSFARIEWPGRDILFFCVLATMMMPYEATLIPHFVLYRELGWTGSFKPLIIPYLMGTPFYIFLLRQFFLNIPGELSSAARIDGCTEFGIYARIILPLAKPALTTTALFMFLFQWGDFLNPLIYLQDDRQWTLALALQNFQSNRESEWGPLLAMSTVMTLPIVALFFFTQRTFIQGIALTGLKG